MPAGRNRVQVNRQRLGRARDLLGVVRVTVFSPDDLTLVKGGPADRRRFLDDTLVALAVKYDALRLELDRIVRQRNMLLSQAGGRLDEAAAIDARRLGRQARRRRRPLRPRPGARSSSGSRPIVVEAYAQLAGAADARSAALRPAVAARRAGRRARPRRATPTCGAACRPSVRTATSSSCRSTACRRAPTPRRASSARSRWRCAWRPPPGRRPHRLDAGARARRRAVRARPAAGRRRCSDTCRRPGRDHDGVGACRPRHAPTACCASPTARVVGRRPAGVDGRARRAAVSDDDPVPVTAALDGLLRSLRGGAGRRRGRRRVRALGGGRRRRRSPPTSARCGSSTARCSSRSTTRRGRPSCASSSRRPPRAACASVAGVEVDRVEVRVRAGR